jgi:hypothetical protein
MKQGFGLGSLLVLAATAIAGGPGYELVEACVADLQQLEDRYNARASALVSAAEAKLALLDDRGASNERLQIEANKFIDRLTAVEFDSYAGANRITRRYFVRIINLDESSLIDQLDDANEARNDFIFNVGFAGDDYENAVTAALNTEQTD